MRVLTQASDLRCGPPIPAPPCGHGGQLTLVASQSKLTIGGQAVLVDGDLAGVVIANCTTAADPTNGFVPCFATTSALGGVATKLTVGNLGVLLEDVQGGTGGTCGGTPQTWRVADPGQAQLTVG